MSALDRLAIHELYSRYSWAIDLGDGEGFAAGFTEDGVFRSVDGFGPQAHGREELLRFPIPAGLRERGGQHWTSNIVIDFAGDDLAHAQCYVVALFPTTQPPDIGEPGAFIERVGHYVDRIVRVAEHEWRISERVFHPVLPVPVH